MITLIGSPQSKRTYYFMQAARALKTPVTVLTYSQALTATLTGAVKIDPPVHSETDICQINALSQEYIRFLQAMAARKNVNYVNHPAGLISLLDKKICKKRLIEHGIPTPPLVAENVGSVEQLLAIMQASKITRMFIKPTLGSGAAGVIAWRRHPDGIRQVLYCAIAIDGSRLFNSNKIHSYQDDVQIRRIISAVLQQENIVECWLPKASVNGKSYDLRVVCMDGKILWRVVRTSSQPITNLHLQNQASEFASLGLSAAKVAEIDALCLNAIQLFPDIRLAGIDVLLTRNLTPYIIEINGQGDLIYQDAQNENHIYRAQIQAIRSQYV
ncbi:STM4014 family protein [Superficieibacter electus]|nr:STM4014 family protein [Superficieibacter electus]